MFFVEHKNLHDLIDEVREEHINRLDIPADDLTPKPRRKRRPAKTALLSIEAKKAYRRRIVIQTLAFD